VFTTRLKHFRRPRQLPYRLNSLTPAKLGVERRVGRRGSDWQTRRSNGPMPYDRHCNDVATIEAPSLRRDPRLLVTLALTGRGRGENVTSCNTVRSHGLCKFPYSGDTMVANCYTPFNTLYLLTDVLVCRDLFVCVCAGHFILTGDIYNDFHLQTGDIHVNRRRRRFANALFRGSGLVGSAGCALKFFSRVESGLGLRSVFGCMPPVDMICKFVCIG